MFFCIFNYIHIFNQIELITQDLRFRLRPEIRTSSRIGTIDINETIIKRAGTWPISRRYYADFLYILKKYDASLLVFDIFFPDNGPLDITPEKIKEAQSIIKYDLSDNEKQKHLTTFLKEITHNADDDMITALKNTNIAILAQTFSLANTSFAHDISDIKTRVLKEKENMPDIYKKGLEMAKKFSIPFPLNSYSKKNIARAFNVEPPHPKFLNYSTGLGYAQIIADTDGVIRKYPLMIHYDGRLYPSTVLMAYSILSGVALSEIEVVPGKYIRFPGNMKASGDSTGFSTPLTIPVDTKLRMTTNWSGDYLDTFTHFPAALIMQFRGETYIREQLLSYGENWQKMAENAISLITKKVEKLKMLKTGQAQPMVQILFFARLVELRKKLGIKTKTKFINSCNPSGDLKLRKELSDIWDQVLLNHRIYEILKNRKNMTYHELKKTIIIPDDKNLIQENAFNQLSFIAKRNKNIKNWYPLYFFHSSELSMGSQRKKSKISPVDLADKILFIGLTATGTHDFKPMPFNPFYPMVGLHSNSMNTILTRNFVGEIPKIYNFLLILTISGLFSLIISGFKPFSSTLFVILISGLYCFIVKEVFNLTGRFLPLVPVIGTITTNYLFIVVLKFVNERRERQRTKSIFSTYLSSAVVDMVLDDPNLLTLGGKRREMSVYFSDLSGFTTISENFSPEELVRIINEYFEAMTNIIYKYNGTLDKYSGDGIMAFWNAPADQKDHAFLTCCAALDCQRCLISELHPRWRKQSLPLLTMRAGINTGSMVVGNMGSNTRMDYTVMGDAVNLGARLELANKSFETEIMMGENTQKHTKGLIVDRELDLLRVKGKTEAIKVYQVISRTEDLTVHMNQMLFHYNNGLTFYKEQKWQKAIKAFSKALSINSADGPSKTYMKRCQTFLQNPPPNNWDGVLVLKSK